MAATFVILVIGLISWVAEAPLNAQAGKTRAREVPVFQVDPSWPKIPDKWVLGEVSSVAVDARNNIWVLHRPRTVRPAQKSMAAPPVLVFNAAYSERVP